MKNLLMLCIGYTLALYGCASSPKPPDTSPVPSVPPDETQIEAAPPAPLEQEVKGA
jgi:hypothetical protein